MKRILIFLALLLAAYVSFSQSPIHGRLRVISGTYDNYFQNGTDTFKLGWRTDRFQLKYNTNKRFIDFIKSDSTVKIYNKLILESPNDTMLSVRGDAYFQNLLTTENIVVGDSLLYSIDAGESVGDLYGYVNAKRFYPNRFYIYDDYTSYFSLLQQIKFVDTLSGIVYTTYVNGAFFNGSQTVVELGDIIYDIFGNHYGYIDFGLPIAQGKIKVDGILEVADSVLVVSSADSISTFNGVVTVNDLLNTNNIVVADSVLVISSVDSTSVFNGVVTVNDLLNTNNIVVADSVLYSNSTAFYDTLRFHNITIDSDGWQNLYISIDGDVSQYFHQYDSIIIHDTIISAEYTLQVFQSYYNNGVFTVLVMYGGTPFPPQGTTYGWLEFYNPIVDTTVINKIIVNGVFEISDSVLIINPADSTSIFNGKVIMRNPTDTLLSVRGNAYVADTTFMEHLEVTDSVTLEDALFDIYHLAPDSDSLLVADDGIINLRTGAYGELRVWVFNSGMYAEYAVVILNVDGSIGIMTENSANVTNVGGTDGKLNIYDGGAYTIIENKLGGNRTIKYTFIH